MRRSLASAAALTLAAALAPLASAAANVDLDTTLGPPGTVVTPKGTGFPAGAAVTVAFAGQAVSTTPAAPVVAADGRLPAFTFTVPAAPGGGHPVLVRAGGTTGEATFVVHGGLTPTTLSLANGAAGSFLAVGFKPGVSLTFTFAGLPLATDPAAPVADATGSALVNFVAPDIAYGTHPVVAQDGFGGQGFGHVKIQPTLTVVNASAPALGYVTHRGSGFTGDQAITTALVRGDGSEIVLETRPLTLHSNSKGGWSRHEAKVPALPAGTYTLRVTDAKGVRAEAPLVVGPSVSLSAAAAAPGDKVTVTGAGWPAGATVSFALDGAALATSPRLATADSAGSFAAVTLTVPNHAAAKVAVTARETGGLAASAPFEVKSAPARPDVDPQSSRHTVTPAAADGPNGWYSTPPVVALYGGDADALQWRIDGGEWRAYVGPFEVPEGRHTVEYFATSVTGKAEAAHAVTITHDATPPVVERLAVEGTGGTRRIAVTATDVGSGVATVTLEVGIRGGPATTTLAATRDGGGWTATFTPTTAGTYAVAARVKDVAGHESTKSDYAFDVTAADLRSTGSGGVNGDGPARGTPGPGLAIAGAALVAVALALRRRA